MNSPKRTLPPGDAPWIDRRPVAPRLVLRSRSSLTGLDGFDPAISAEWTSPPNALSFPRRFETLVQVVIPNDRQKEHRSEHASRTENRAQSVEIKVSQKALGAWDDQTAHAIAIFGTPTKVTTRRPSVHPSHRTTGPARHRFVGTETSKAAQELPTEEPSYAQHRS